MISNGKSMPHSGIPKWILVSLFGLALLGFIDATYLTAEHYLGKIPPCSLVEGCETVLTSAYAAIFGIPTALFGSLFYFAVFILLIAYRETKSPAFIAALLVVSSLGFLASLGFVYLQLFVVRAICLYCMASAATSTLIFALSALAFKRTGTPAASS